MSEAGPDTERDPHRPWVMTALAGIMLAAFAYLVFGPGFTIEFAGIGALLALPFCLGALLTLGTRRYSPLGCFAAPILLGVVSYTLVALGAEGLICVVMVMPIWAIAGLGGGIAALAFGYLGDPSERDKDVGDVTLKSVGLAVVPFLLIYGDAAAPAQWERHAVARSIVIEAPSETVWPRLVAIPDIASGEGTRNLTHDWLGVPRPTDARLERRAGRTVRMAQWGDAVRFEEIVTRIEPGESMAWRFAFPDDSVQNHTDRHIAPDGDLLRIEAGRYQLESLGADRTRVTLTTTYRTRTRFDWYFGWWGERLLGDVQDNVLAIVAQRSERAAATR